MNWNKGVSLPQLPVGVWGRYNLTFSFRLGPHPAGKRSGGQRQRKMTTWNLYRKKWVKMALALSTVSMPANQASCQKNKKIHHRRPCCGFSRHFRIYAAPRRNWSVLAFQLPEISIFNCCVSTIGGPSWIGGHSSKDCDFVFNRYCCSNVTFYMLNFQGLRD